MLHARFSPDGKRIVTASEDFTARVWEAATGKLLLPPLQHRAQVYEACFSADGRWIVTTCRDGTARVWDAESGEAITPPLQHSWESLYTRFVVDNRAKITRTYVQFIAHDRAIVTRTATGESVVWELPGDPHPLEDLAPLAQLLSGHQRDFTGGVLPQTREALSKHWERLRALYPADFTVSENEVVAWHQREAEASEKMAKASEKMGEASAKAAQWRAAVFHWDRLIEIKPQEKFFQDRRAAAQQRLISGQE